MHWLEFAAGALTMSGVSAGIGVITYTVKTRGWSYFTSLKFIGRKPTRKPLSLEMRLELGSDMEMAEWDERFRKLAEPLERAKAAQEWARVQADIVRRTVEARVRADAAALAARHRREHESAESAERRCDHCEYEEQHTYADRHVRLVKTWACASCREADRKDAERDAMNRIRDIYSGRA